MSPTQNSQNTYVCWYKQFYKTGKNAEQNKTKELQKVLDRFKRLFTRVVWLLMSNVAHFAYQTPGVNGGRVVA